MPRPAFVQVEDQEKRGEEPYMHHQHAQAADDLGGSWRWNDIEHRDVAGSGNEAFLVSVWYGTLPFTTGQEGMQG